MGSPVRKVWPHGILAEAGEEQRRGRVHGAEVSRDPHLKEREDQQR